MQYIVHCTLYTACWKKLASLLPREKFCYGWLHRRLLRRYRPQSAVNCSTLWERAAGSSPNTSQVSLMLNAASPHCSHRLEMYWSFPAARLRCCTLYAMQCTMQQGTLIIVHDTLYTLHCTRTLYTAHCTLHTAHCTLHTVHCTLYTCTLCIVFSIIHCTLYIVFCTLYVRTLYNAHCTLYIALYTAHRTPYTLHSAYTQSFVHCTLCIVCWKKLASLLPREKFCYGWLHRRLLRRYRPQSAVNCSTLWERAAGSSPNTSQVSLTPNPARPNASPSLRMNLSVVTAPVQPQHFS